MRQTCIQIVAFFMVAFLSLNCSNPEQVSGVFVNNNGVALLKIATATSGPFQKMARKAVLTISAADILTLTKNLSITDSSVEGKITGIPVGKSRLFTISVYDSLNVVQYKGSSTADVTPDSAVTISIKVARVTSSANINGNVTEDTVAGYQYYRFVVNAVAFGSTTTTCLTETHFMLNAVAFPPADTYSVVSYSPTQSGSDINSLFNNDGSANTGFLKFEGTPWEWIIDMKKVYKFDAFFIACWQVGFYVEPNDFSIYGSTSYLGPWKLLGEKKDTVAYTSQLVPLSY
jgi:hypothetical protein